MLIFGVLSFTIIPISTELLLVKYNNACLRLFVVILLDLHCLQRSYHNVDHLYITLYHHTNFQLLLVRYRNASLRLFVVILQDLHCLHRSYHNVDNWYIALYYHTNFHIY